jgi:hypothetical protein
MSVYTRNEESPPPVYTFKGHQVEGFAMDWSPIVEGMIAADRLESQNVVSCGKVGKLKKLSPLVKLEYSESCLPW